VEYRYKQEVLDRLPAHGVMPTRAHSPDLVHDFVSDLYRYELRRLRERLRRREIAKAHYADRVVEVRRRYPLLALKAWQWTEP